MDKLTNAKNVDKLRPKFVLNCGRIFRVEGEDVAHYDDGVQQDQQPHDEDVSQGRVKVTQQLRHWSVKV